MKPIDLRQLLKKIHTLLDIEWIHEDRAGPSPIAAGDASLLSLFLLRSDLDELISLGEIGHVVKIQEKLNALADGSPARSAFVTRMRILVNAFDLKRYVAVLEEIRGRHAQD